MAPMCHVPEDPLTSCPRFLWCDSTHPTEHHSAIAPEAGVVGAYAARLYPQYKARQSAVVDLKRFALRLSLFAREQRRSDEDLHGDALRLMPLNLDLGRLRL